MLTRDKSNGQFIGKTRERALKVACIALTSLLDSYAQGDTEEAIQVLNSEHIRPITLVEVVQGRPLTSEEALQYRSYPCVSEELRTAMHAGKELEELKRLARVRLHKTEEFTVKFTRFIELVTSRNRTQ